MSISLVEIFSDFLFLRLYLPGLLVVTTLSGYSFFDKSIGWERVSLDSSLVWGIAPLVIGLCLHVIYAFIALATGFEHVSEVGSPCVPVCVLTRVQKSRHIYQNNVDAAKRTFGFGNLYINCFTGLLFCRWGGCFDGLKGWMIAWPWAISAFFLLAGVLNILYGRAILASLPCDNLSTKSSD